MAKIDQKFNLGGCGVEMHVGQNPGDSGTNAAGPSDSPSNPASVVINANGGKPFNVTVGSTKIVSPA